MDGEHECISELTGSPHCDIKYVTFIGLCKL